MELIEHDGSYYIYADGQVLMSTRVVHSERELARLACEDLPPNARVLIGGLGCGFTLRQALDHARDDTTVVQAELVPEVVEWNRGPLGPFADHPLKDPRTELVVNDVAAVIREATADYDSIMLDVDNGPSAVVTNTNAWLYSPAGLREIHSALRPRGRVAIWSADDDPRFPARLEKNGFKAARHRIRGRAGGKGAHFFVYLGRRSS